MKKRMKKSLIIKRTLSWMIFTNHCPYCEELISKDEVLCKECSVNLPAVTGEKCKCCGAGKDRCNCRKHKLGFDGITSPYYYEDSIKKSIHYLKFNGRYFIAHTLAQDMAKSVREDFENIHFDFISFVPYSISQKLRRSYNQSELLAESLSKGLNIPLNRVMVKLFNTNTQHKMSVGRRKGNVFGVYDVKEDVDVKGKTVLLVDDVKTSGATLDDCAWALKTRGADKVYCVVAALAGVKSKEKAED